MTHDYLNDIDRLGRQLSELRATLSRQAGDKADDAASYIAPRARDFARQVQRQGYGLTSAARRNPTAATGAVVAALAVGAVLGLFLAGATRQED